MEGHYIFYIWYTGTPEPGGRRGKAQIKRRLLTTRNNDVVQAEFTFAVNRTFHRRKSCKGLRSHALSQQTGRGDLLLSQELGTLYALPLRYMMMRFTEGEPLQAMKEELQEITGGCNLNGISHY